MKQNNFPEFVGKLIIKFLSISLLTIISSDLYGQTPTDFSGKWVFDISKSKPGADGSFGSSDITHIITQNPSSITITEILGEQDYSIIDIFPLNGEATIEIQGSRKINRSAAWTTDKKILILTTIMTIEGNDYRLDDTYKLSDNGLTLTVQSVSKDINGENTVIWVYNKKED
jgi:hypothetical protein